MLLFDGHNIYTTSTPRKGRDLGDVEGSQGGEWWILSKNEIKEEWRVNVDGEENFLIPIDFSFGVCL
jgi:hypothetical protein